MLCFPLFKDAKYNLNKLGILNQTGSLTRQQRPHNQFIANTYPDFYLLVSKFYKGGKKVNTFLDQAWLAAEGSQIGLHFLQ